MGSTSKDFASIAPVAAMHPSSSATAAASSSPPVEDEARKKKTDCVYFLASPLTCKKGSECEYRHSEYARVNPRDCWFWMNGSCLNPKCSFRHPPLDGLMGSQTADSSGASAVGSLSSSQPSPQFAPSTQYATAKQTAPCIFFQQGYCMKGDFCPFSHMMQCPTGSKPSQFSAALGGSEPASSKKPFGGLERCSQQKTLPQAHVSKAADALTVPKANAKAAPVLARNGASAEKYSQKPPVFIGEEQPDQKMTTTQPFDNRSVRNKSVPVTSLEDQSFINGKEVDESLRESSPGFDVLVDNNQGSPDYYVDKEQFHTYNDPHSYGRYEERYAQDHLRPSSERLPVEAPQYHRRAARGKGGSADGTENLDLRHRLLKQRRGNGLKSVVSADYASGSHTEERNYRSSKRDSSLPLRESALSGRLQGRIKLPRRSSPVKSANEEYDRVRNQRRLSPTKPHFSSHRSRIQDRLGGRVLPDDADRASTRIRSDGINEGTNFSGPKSLAKLRRSKHPQNNEQHARSLDSISLGKRKALEHSQDKCDDVLFEGPKPLSEILKRKRESGSASSMGSKVPGIRYRSTLSSIAVISEKSPPEGGATVSAPAMDERDNNPVHEEKNSKSVSAGESEAQNHDSSKMNETVDPGSNKLMNNSEPEEGLINNEVEDIECEGEYEPEGEEEYEYEGEDGEEGYVEEAENGLPEDYMDEDDGGDDFAKKIGVMLS